VAYHCSGALPRRVGSNSSPGVFMKKFSLVSCLLLAGCAGGAVIAPQATEAPPPPTVVEVVPAPVAAPPPEVGVVQRPVRPPPVRVVVVEHPTVTSSSHGGGCGSRGGPGYRLANGRRASWREASMHHHRKHR
jgi:hypothetical protein